MKTTALSWIAPDARRTRQLRSQEDVTRSRRDNARGPGGGRSTPTGSRWAVRALFAVHTLVTNACRHVKRAMAHHGFAGFLEAAAIALQCVALMASIVH